MDAASIASTMIQQQMALTQQQMTVSLQKSNMEAQKSIIDLLDATAVASAPAAPSANAAITGRGQVIDISV